MADFGASVQHRDVGRRVVLFVLCWICVLHFRAYKHLDSEGRTTETKDRKQ